MEGNAFIRLSLKPFLMNKKRPSSFTTIVLPVFNEASLVPEIASAVRRFLKKNQSCSVIVVDDGSMDGTASLFKKHLVKVPRVDVMALPENGGKGKAVRLAFATTKADRLIFMDGDLAYSFDHIAPMVKALKKDDMVIGCRSMAAQAQGALPIRRAILGWGFNRLACWLLGLDYPDTQAGLKGFRKKAAEQLFRRQKMDDFSFDAEILYLARKLNLSVGQIPATVSGWHTYKLSHVKLCLDTFRCLSDFIKIRWFSLQGLYDFS